MCKIEITTPAATATPNKPDAAAASDVDLDKNGNPIPVAQGNKDDVAAATALSSSSSSSSSSPSTTTTTVSLEAGQDDFYWSTTEEPHASRRLEILAKYPEIKKLYGHDRWLKYKVLFAVVLQTTCAYYVKDASWTVYIATAYFIGAVANHMLMMALHELSHHLGFRSFFHNKLFSLFANLPIGIPAAISFKRYHMDHHKYQGEDKVDVDIPTAWEGRWVNNTVAKFLFVVCQGAFYALRPVVVHPKKPGVWELANALVCIAFDLLVYYFMGLSSLLYLLMSTMIGTGFHPVAGHFIAEHYVFSEGHETYSYYGWWNLVTFNVGYHNEHHDFPFIPGSRLPQVRAIASEYYDPLPRHDCWVTVLYNFITDPKITAFSRVKRQTMSAEEAESLKKRQ